MHEVSLMATAVEVAEQHARDAGGTRIRVLRVRIGEASGVVREALEFAFEAVTVGTMAEGASFDVQVVPTLCYCSNCKEEFTPTSVFRECPTCGSFSADIRQGMELELASLEVT
ncbi:hydrogenase maturation nickel metallochaperone HypA [Candidatus Poribacteria bacterium]|jgi:hydrogenase nickel incorporation protein HypA/HybF|nr:hydrogenase maturation nickel metallochaperone HypA [Candidatus Poribacteria bacterium]MBT5532583.1 hydrogenase maturation nickel metallochaperone HypA [Candidatus Poribacteria bacterium]MBT5710678.1 hydrogenase maturation nickel metallochaperone HypA [Candidatus Poribacteria bacterium]MBT7101861.1 hydrogenase maturation nickel metallochaperone HypA [Candidatus Poribacteria bacterium]MBT7805056.1 hydrogenase maturation nickel metallochaperone HypA [Candidatus Poribacteria bacterium]